MPAAECECEGQRVTRVETGPTIVSRDRDTCKAAEGVTTVATELPTELSRDDLRPDVGCSKYCPVCYGGGQQILSMGGACTGAVTIGATTSHEQCRAEDLSQSDGAGEAADDFSVSYALHYPNKCADPALQEQDLTVGEHVDPSLFVVEPCCGVEGLEIRDRASGR